MTPWPLMTALIAPISGRLSDRISPEKLGIAGLCLLAAGLAAVASMGERPDSFDIVWRLALCGFGFGLFQSPNNRIIITSAPRERSGGASGLQSTGRLLGQSMGAAVAAVIFSLVAQGQTELIAWIGAGLALVGAVSSGLRKPG
jgi:DHA2 family multidrug resistance protein-like MFS transporter